MTEKLDRFLEAALAQKGDKYKFGAEVDLNDPNPKAFDSSELVEWAANQAGVKLPDGSWNQYRHLHEAGTTLPIEDALQRKGALVFGFSSDPLESSGRPARAYVGISLGDGTVLDISERSGEVRVMEPGGFYTHGAVIQEMRDPNVFDPALDLGPTDDPNWVPPRYRPGQEQGPQPQDGRTDDPDDATPVQVPDEGGVCYPEDEAPEPQDGGVCYPDDDQSMVPYEAPADTGSYGTDEPDLYAADSTSSSDAGFFDA